MDFELTETQKLLKSNARSFMEREIIPYVNQYEKMRPFPKEAAREVLKKIIPLGYLNGPFPEKYDGEGLDWVSYAVLYEELAKAWSSLAGIVQIQISSAYVLSQSRERDQRAYLADLFTADRIFCRAATEPDVGSNLAEIKTTASRQEDGYIVNGVKSWISCGLWADTVELLAATEKARGSKGLSILLVDKERSPFSARSLPKLGMHCWDTAELTFEDCRVPKENIVGEPGTGLKQFLDGTNIARCTISLNSLGVAQAALEAATQYAKERHQFGKAIGRFQMVQEMIAGMTAEVEAARFLVYRAFQSLGKGEGKIRDVALAKAYAPRVAARVTSGAMEILGAYGLSEEYPMERYFRDARVTMVPDGTSQITSLAAGREILGMSAFD